MLNDVQEDIEKISTLDVFQIPKTITGSNASQDNLHHLLKKSSAMIESHLNNLEDLKARKIFLKQSF